MENLNQLISTKKNIIELLWGCKKNYINIKKMKPQRYKCIESQKDRKGMYTKNNKKQQHTG